jgi:hypothetical protein
MLKTFSGKMRLAIALTLAWSVFTVFYVFDKSHGHICFLVLGILPIAAIWGIYWVIQSIKNDKDNIKKAVEGSDIGKL